MKTLRRSFSVLLTVAGLTLAAPPPVEVPDAKRFDVTKLRAAGLNCPDAVPDDSADDSDAFTCAMGFFKDQPGVLHVPVGRYLVSKHIEVPQRSQIVGDGYGSEIFQLAAPEFKTLPLISLDVGSILRDLKLDQDQPAPQGPGTGFTPNSDFHFMIEARRQDILVENVLLFKAYKGIFAGSHGGGRITLRNIRGQALAIGIQIDDAWDVVRVQDVHFWPYWSDLIDVNGTQNNGGNDVAEFVRQNGIGIVTKKNDNSFMNNITTLGYQIGILFDDSALGSTSKAKISHFDCDFCGIGVELRAKNSRGNVIQSMSFLGEPSLSLRLPLLVTGSESGISVSEAAVDNVSGSAVWVRGGDNFVRLSQWYVRQWNQNNNSIKAFADTSGSSKTWVWESYGRWGLNGGPCVGVQVCEFAVGQPL